MNEEAKSIIEDIFSDLTSDYEENLEILAQKKEKYKSHPRYNNILDKILIKEKEYLSNENKEAYNKMISTYADSINYGIGLAKDYFEKEDIKSCKQVLETLIKSFSNSYINDEFANCVYFDNEFEKELYTLGYKDYRLLINCDVNKGYVYYMYGRILLEDNKVNEALLCFDMAKTYSPFLKEAYFFKALLLKVHKRFDEAKEEMLLAHKYIYKDIDLADFYYFIGNYCYKFINKEYEIVMYQKSYELNPNKELYDELVSIKSIDTSVELSQKQFLDICQKEGLPKGFNEEIVESLEKLKDKFSFESEDVKV